MHSGHGFESSRNAKGLSTYLTLSLSLVLSNISFQKNPIRLQISNFEYWTKIAASVPILRNVLKLIEPFI